MGAGYGIVRGLETLVGGAQAGQADQRELERQARMDALQQRLLEANIADIGSQQTLRSAQAKALAAKPYTTEITDEEWAGFTADKPQLQKIPKAARVKVLEQYTGSQFKPPERPFEVPAGGKLVDRAGKVIAMGTPKPERAERPISLAPGAKLVDRAGNEIARGDPKKLSVVERETNAAARTGLALIKDMKGLRRASPTASQLPVGTAIARGPQHLPVIGDALKGATEPLAQQFMSQSQAAYQQKADQLLHLASSVLPKGGRSIALLANLRASFTSPALAKNPMAAVQALNELEKQLTEVLGDAPDPTAGIASGGFQFKHTKPKGQ